MLEVCPVYVYLFISFVDTVLKVKSVHCSCLKRRGTPEAKAEVGREQSS
jgi:hypothetical protein